MKTVVEITATENELVT